MNKNDRRGSSADRSGNNGNRSGNNGNRSGGKRQGRTGGKGGNMRQPRITNGRELALLALQEIWDKGAYTAIATNSLLRKYKLEPQERRFATELTSGAVKAKGTLDYILSGLVTQPLSKVEPVIHYILQLGIYQIFFLDRIPDSAACNESVELAKKFSHKGADKFVNGVLRNAVRQKDELFPVTGFKGKKALKQVAVNLCHPMWLVKRWNEQFGAEATDAICACDNMVPPLTMRVNPLVIGREAFLEKLKEVEVEAEASKWSPEGIICTHIPGLKMLFDKFTAAFYIQDESSMLPAAVLAPKAGEKVLDMCSAPGGKTTHAAILLKMAEKEAAAEGKKVAPGSVTACDIYAHKLQLVEDNAKRLKLDNIEVMEKDATVYDRNMKDMYDCVLVDAPCSGLGVLRRRAEARWVKTEKSLAEFPPLQKVILRNAARYVKEGGRIVYSTCTMEEAENSLVVQSFMEENPEWEQAGFLHPVTGEEVKELQLLPHVDGTDGFYLTLLRKKA